MIQGPIIIIFAIESGNRFCCFYRGLNKTILKRMLICACVCCNCKQEFVDNRFYFELKEIG